MAGSRSKGIFTACHLYRKHELVKLCELAQELDLEKITGQLPLTNNSFAPLSGSASIIIPRK